MTASSPKWSPGPRTWSDAVSPSGVVTRAARRPLATRCRLSPGSPSWNTTSFRAKRRRRAAASTARRSSSVSSPSSGHCTAALSGSSGGGVQHSHARKHVGGEDGETDGPPQEAPHRNGRDGSKSEASPYVDAGADPTEASRYHAEVLFFHARQHAAVEQV